MLRKVLLALILSLPMCCPVAAQETHVTAMTAGRRVFGVNNFQEAERQFQAALQLAETDKQKANALYALGVVAQRQNRLVEARERAQKALSLGNQQAQSLLDELSTTSRTPITKSDARSAGQQPPSLPAQAQKFAPKTVVAPAEAVRGPVAIAIDCPGRTPERDSGDYRPHKGEVSEYLGRCDNKPHGAMIWKAHGAPVAIECIGRNDLFLGYVAKPVTGMGAWKTSCKIDAKKLPGFCELNPISDIHTIIKPTADTSALKGKKIEWSFFGQCAANVPNGIGLKIESNYHKQPSVWGSWDVFYHQGAFKAGEAHGFGKKEHYVCGQTDCHLKVTQTGWFQNGTFQYVCANHTDCLNAARTASFNSFDCSKVLALDKVLVGEPPRFAECLEASRNSAVAGLHCAKVAELDRTIGKAPRHADCLKGMRSKAVAEARCDDVKSLDAQLGDLSGLEACLKVVESQHLEKQIAEWRAKRGAALSKLDCNEVRVLDGQIGGQGEHPNCIKEQQRKQEVAEREQKIAARKLALAALNCEVVKDLDAKLGDSTYPVCIFDKMLKSGAANELYISAGKYENSGDLQRARQLFAAIVDRFPNDPLAIKATDNLTTIARTESAAEQARAAKEAQQRAAQAAQAQAQICSHVYVGQRINQAAFWGLGLVTWEVVGVSPASEQLTIRDTSGGMGTKQISCSEAAHLLHKNGKW